MRVTAVRGSMDRFILTSESKVVGASTILKIDFSCQHDLPLGGYIFVSFPVWNPENGDPDTQKSYIQGSESCDPSSSNLSADMVCVH